jgi:hypothetical protein
VKSTDKVCRRVKSQTASENEEENKPKSPTSAFNFFKKEVFARLKQERNLSVQETTKLVGELWSGLTK